MHASDSTVKPAAPSEELRVGVTFPKPGGGPGPTKPGVRLSLDNVMDFVPERQVMDEGIDELTKRGFKLTGRGKLTVSMKCTKDEFENAFNTKLKVIRMDPKKDYAFHYFYFPHHRAPWTPILEELIDDVYIQWPHMYMATTISAKPPRVKYYHLNVPNDVASLLRAKEVHTRGNRGEGIRVVMIDSGFAHKSHPFFTPYKSRVVLAGDAKNRKKDIVGHGTGESANIFSVAPGVEFIGVKIGSDKEKWDRNPATLLEGFYRARQQDPDIISISGSFDLRVQKSNKQRSRLPRNLRALEAEILHAIASGITVIAAAGNGTFSFPAMMPDVISAGGVFVDQDRSMKASDIASAFDSKIYRGRHVPDFCGLVGTGPKLNNKGLKLLSNQMPLDRYIMLPVPIDSDFDRLYPDGTKQSDGWAAFSGTSAAAPQIAGVCALLKAMNRTFTPSDLKGIIGVTARKVSRGHSNPRSSDSGTTPHRGRGAGGATGAGLVDAFGAWKQVSRI